MNSRGLEERFETQDILRLRAIKKSAAVLLALARLNQPLGEAGVAAVLDIDPATARRHLRSLAELGLVERRVGEGTYRLSETGRGLLATSLPGGSYPPEVPGPAAERPGPPRRKRRARGMGRGLQKAACNRPAGREKFSRATTSTTTSTPVKHLDSRAAAAGQAGNELEELAAQNLAAFRAEGVGSNRRVMEVCEMGHVTPDYIHAQARRLREEKRMSSKLLLFVVQSGDPLPAPEEVPPEEDNRRYVTGKWAEFIEH